VFEKSPGDGLKKCFFLTAAVKEYTPRARKIWNDGKYFSIDNIEGLLF